MVPIVIESVCFHCRVQADNLNAAVGCLPRAGVYVLLRSAGAEGFDIAPLPVGILAANGRCDEFEQFVGVGVRCYVYRDVPVTAPLTGQAERGCHGGKRRA
jgi:hypothetical protein